MISGTTESLFGDADHDGYRVSIEAFEGPLDLLLHLIKKNEVDIYNIPIANITRQYLDYVDLMKELNLDVAGEFLVMASTLVQIKSKMLLPPAEDPDSGEEEEQDPRAELVRRLLEYQKYKEAGLVLGARELLGREVFARSVQAPELEELRPEEEPVEVELFELIEAFQRVLAKVPVETFHEVGAENISIADRITDILDRLQDRESLMFEELFAAPLSREFFIATFLAILELCKLRMIKVVQATSFGTIWILRAVLDPQEIEQ
ncbi:ScpA family protein [Geobacter sp. DSM 9736]|uniref:segregation and condensation protein A n=1 Tax=Geobacter sp. DSM 9736 TaxID=1277350 RepID=UPI000B50D3F6|nr:segregation/condensation protein A [Geobacter sp. DSM 9736]SNB45685.1 condensin subunit ScpA [Geobacter sp. DSM 9736]